MLNFNHITLTTLREIGIHDFNNEEEIFLQMAQKIKFMDKEISQLREVINEKKRK